MSVMSKASQCPKAIQNHRPDQVAESMVSYDNKLYTTLWSFVPDMEARMNKENVQCGLMERADPEFSMSYYWSKLSYSEQQDLIWFIDNPE